MPDLPVLPLPVPGQNSPDTSMSLPEAIQWLLETGYNTLQYAWPESTAAALIDLAIAGRISSTPSTSIFKSPVGRRIVVLDATPTGHPELDVALDFLAQRTKNKRVTSDFRTIGGLVSSVVQKRLIGSGAVEMFGEFRINSSYLVVKDAERQALATNWLHLVRDNPSAVTDPRAGALSDILFNTFAKFRPERVLEPSIQHEWYSAELRPTVEGILHTLEAETANVYITS